MPLPHNACKASRSASGASPARLLSGGDPVGRGNLELWCQAIVPLCGEDNGQHFEVLLRQRASPAIDAVAGVGETAQPLPGIPGAPTELIAQAKATGLAARLDRWVVHEALGWLESHPRQAAGVRSCSINLSACSLAEPAFGRYLRQRVERSSVSPTRLCFEITETGPIGDIERAAALIRRLRTLGCRFALDDFGSGYCSFAYLTQFELDWVKIDGGLVRDALSSPVALAILQSIVRIAHVAGLQSVAEWVDSAALLQRMHELGIDYAQGNHCGLPMPLDAYLGHALAAGWDE